MAKKQNDKPMYRITMARAQVDMAMECPEVYDEARLRETLAEAQYAIHMLMDFRNIINGMVQFDEEPKEAARPYLDNLQAAE